MLRSLLQSTKYLLRFRGPYGRGPSRFQLPFSAEESPLLRPPCLVQWDLAAGPQITGFHKRKHPVSVLTLTNGSLALQFQGCALPMMTATAWPAAHLMAASLCASWCLPHPLCSMCCEDTPVVSRISPGLSPMTSLCPPHSMLPCASGPLRMASASGRSRTLMALNCSAVPSSRSTTTSLWSGSRTPAC